MVIVPADAPAGISAAYTVDAVKVYGKGLTEVRALDGVTVGFADGEFGAIMGPSGSGKSTLMHCMAGLDTLTSGRAFIGDQDLGTLDDGHLTVLRRDRIGFVFQALNLVPTLTALENVTLPLALAGRKGEESSIQHVIDMVCLGDRVAHRPSELSGGQQQRVAIARALASRPQIVFADEPTGTSTPGPARRCSGSCAAPSMRWVRPSSWSPMTPLPSATPTASCSSPTEGSSTRCHARRPSWCLTG